MPKKLKEPHPVSGCPYGDAGCTLGGLPHARATAFQHRRFARDPLQAVILRAHYSRVAVEWKRQRRLERKLERQVAACA